MQLVIKRNKKGGLAGKSKYELYVRADVTAEEQALINENSLDPLELVYHQKTDDSPGFFAALMRMLKDTRMTVKTFVRGTTFTCRDVVELLHIEEQAREMALNLRAILECAATFGGEEVIAVEAAFEETVLNKQKSRA